MCDQIAAQNLADNNNLNATSVLGNIGSLNSSFDEASLKLDTKTNTLKISFPIIHFPIFLYVASTHFLTLVFSLMLTLSLVVLLKLSLRFFILKLHFLFTDSKFFFHNNLQWQKPFTYLKFTWRTKQKTFVYFENEGFHCRKTIRVKHKRL